MVVASVATAAIGGGCGGGGAASLGPPSTAATSAPATPEGVATTAAAAPTTTAGIAALAVLNPASAPDGRAARGRHARAAGGTARRQRTCAARHRRPCGVAPDYGHLNQVAYRTRSARPEWDTAALAAIDPDLRGIVQTHLRARREFTGMHTAVASSVPAWQIRAPEPADTLLGYYRKAEAATGIGWPYLVAINLVETGFGRIDGLSTASAIGPMQFLQSTWNGRGIGQGDIRDPHDAIQAAARFLVRRGGPADMAKALQGYNNHANYVRAVMAYADLFRADERSFQAVYHWEIYYFSSAGDLWLPVGYRQAAPVPVADYLAAAPWSAPA
jgi:membrane-bound lytic murein transglycosylase B